MLNISLSRIALSIVAILSFSHALTLHPIQLSGTTVAVSGASETRWYLSWEADSLVSEWQGTGGQSFQVAVPGRASGRTTILGRAGWREHSNTAGTVERHGFVPKSHILSAGGSVVDQSGPTLDEYPSDERIFTKAF